MDEIYTANLDQNAQNNAALNHVELDLSHSLNECASAELAVAYDDGQFGIGAATIRYAPKQAGAENEQSLPLISDWLVSAGQSDAPLGLDYLVYGSLDRKPVTMLFAVETTHGG